MIDPKPGEEAFGQAGDLIDEFERQVIAKLWVERDGRVS